MRPRSTPHSTNAARRWTSSCGATSGACADHHRDRTAPVEFDGGSSYILAASEESEDQEPDTLQPDRHRRDGDEDSFDHRRRSGDAAGTGRCARCWSSATRDTGPASTLSIAGKTETSAGSTRVEAGAVDPTARTQDRNFMELAEILAPEAVRVVGSMTSKKRLFQELGEIAAGLRDSGQEASRCAAGARKSRSDRRGTRHRPAPCACRRARTGHGRLRAA